MEDAQHVGSDADAPPGPPSPAGSGAPLSELSEHSDDGAVNCVCGRTDSEGFMIQCEVPTCLTWQHGECVNIPTRSLTPKHYYCSNCRPDLHPYNRHLLAATAWRRKPSRDLLGLGASNLKTDRAAPSKRKTMNSMEASQSFTELFQLSTNEGSREAESDGGGSGSAKPRKRKRGTGPRKRDADGSSPEDEDSSQADEYAPRPASGGGGRGAKRGRYGGPGRGGRDNVGSRVAESEFKSDSEAESVGEIRPKKPGKPSHGAGGTSGGPDGDASAAGEAAVGESPPNGDAGDSETDSTPPSQWEKPAPKPRPVPEKRPGGAGGPGRGANFGKKAAAHHNAAKEQQQQQQARHVVDHSHPPGAPVNIAELPAVKPKTPSSKASLGEMCKRVRMLTEWAHRMQLNHIPLLGLDVPDPAEDPAPPANPGEEGSRDLMARLLSAIASFQQAYGAYAHVGRARAHPVPGPGGEVPLSEYPSSDPPPQEAAAPAEPLASVEPELEAVASVEPETAAVAV